MPPTKRPAKKAPAKKVAAKKVAVKDVVARHMDTVAAREGDEDSREARTVMQRVDKLPEAPTVGRPSDKYHKLFEAVAGEFGPGVPVKLVVYADHRSARRVLNQIQAGQTPVPGGPGCWVVRAVPEEIEGQAEKGSALYVEWLGNDE